MQGKATLGGHPIHPALVTFPIGCFLAAIVADIISIWANHGFFALMATWLVGFGFCGAILAAIFGIIDLVSAPMTVAAKSVAGWHASLMAGAIVVFGAALAVRAQNPSSTGGYVLTVCGVAIVAIAGWFGGSIAHRHLVGSAETDVSARREAADARISHERAGRAS